MKDFMLGIASLGAACLVLALVVAILFAALIPLIVVLEGNP